MSEWKSMDSAPKDGTRVILVTSDQDKEVVVACYRHGGWVDAYSEEYGVIGPTHWMPLPEPPK